MAAHDLAYSVQNLAWGEIWEAELPEGFAGGWVGIEVTSAVCAAWMKVELSDLARGQVVREVFLRPPRAQGKGQARSSLVHVPQSARSVVVQVFGAAPRGARLRVQALGRVRTALALLRQFAPLLPGCLRGSPLGLVGRCRAVLGQAPARAGDVPPYGAWIAMFEEPVPPPAPPHVPLDVVILAEAEAAALIARSADSVRAQCVAAASVVVVRAPADGAALAGRHVLVLEAGDVLHAHALAWFGATLAANPAAGAIIADADQQAPDGGRMSPLFKPGADDLLLGCGILEWGAALVRLPPEAASLPWGDGAALLRQALQYGAMVHVPRVLTHCWRAPLLREGALSPRAGGSADARVCAIIPSRAASSHVLRCIRAVRAGTRGVRLHLAVALAQPALARPSVLAGLRRIADLEVLELGLAQFNYARANNLAAAMLAGNAAAESEFTLLLNDDVVPAGPDWLATMLAEMADPRVGIVGARLTYGNGMVQHAGVILGLANLAEHAGKLAQGWDAGPCGMWRRTRQVSAVTAACLLIRTSLFRELGGMDEDYVIALNDVDLCLRARERGWRVVYCAAAKLMHYESLSLGRHYQGSRAALEAVETNRLRRRWAEVIAADPFYNPQASLQPGREWQPGFVPRGIGFSATEDQAALSARLKLLAKTEI